MQTNLIQRRARVFKRLLQREAAEHYVLLTLLAFGVSVSITRLFLSLADYPQIGGGELHIAHVLWGGLLLYVAALLPLLFANRGIYTLAALLAGTGVGLFIDEVGKFITRQNDYFYPVAASIIYVVFLLTIILLLHVRRVARTRSRDELTHVFEDIWEALQHTLTPAQYKRLRTRLETAARSAPSPRQADLASALLTFLDADALPEAATIDRPLASARRWRRTMGRAFSENSLRLILVCGLTGIGLLSLKNPASALLAPVLPPGTIDFLLNLHVGRHVDVSSIGVWPSIRIWLEVIVGILLLTSATLLALKRKRVGAATGYLGLLISLTTVDILLFYFEQFSTIITTSIQLLLFGGLMIYRRREGRGSMPAAAVLPDEPARG